jgi:hypothetical protein
MYFGDLFDKIEKRKRFTLHWARNLAQSHGSAGLAARGASQSKGPNGPQLVTQPKGETGLGGPAAQHGTMR